ncbi:hypothetical protein [Streptomyces sp. NPDC060275]|uniref:hypothetical protein n=1 Tax=Streptomyces sp. NPDC060275 TaxID=3347090 RepID=UPI00365B968F
MSQHRASKSRLRRRSALAVSALAGGAAGQLVARPSDVNRLLSALMDGRLLKPAQLREMRTTVETKGLHDGWRATASASSRYR